MTIEEFNETGWSRGLFAKYHADNEIYRIGSCDFEEKLVGLMGVIASEPDCISWVRCENVTLSGSLHSACSAWHRRDTDVPSCGRLLQYRDAQGNMTTGKLSAMSGHILHPTPEPGCRVCVPFKFIEWRYAEPNASDQATASK
jgi:hypothetical protein